MRWPQPLEALVGVNLVVFLGWLLGSTRWMVKYFEVSARNFLRRPWTLLTASVSHADLYSLIGNFQVGERLCAAAVQSPADSLGPNFHVQNSFTQAAGHSA